MKEHLLNLIYLQYVQERTLAILSQQAEDNDIEIYEAYTDILGVVLDIIGYPNNKKDFCGRDGFYQELTNIAMETGKEIEAKQRIERLYYFICGQTLSLYETKKIKNIDFLQNVLEFGFDFD